MTQGRTTGAGVLATALCFAAAVTEGIDLQSAGVAAPGFAAEFHLAPASVGWVFSANTFGVLIGALLGGWLADRLGRKPALVGSIALFGALSLATVLGRDAGSLTWLRLLTGIGLGGALPSLITVAAESGPVARRTRRITVTAAGMPAGTALLGAILLAFPGGLDWRSVFYVGGGSPLLVAFLLALFLPASSARPPADDLPRGPALQTLFGQGRAWATAPIWIAFFFSLTVTYLLLNWLPSLMVGDGYTRVEATLGSMVFGLGSVAGAPLVGHLFDRGRRRLVVAGVYLFAALSLFALASIRRELPLALVAIFCLGVFLVSSQFLLYALAPTYYPKPTRGTGVGAAVAVGRLGSIVGPAAAGLLLSSGRAPGQVILALLGPIALTFFAAMLLVCRSPIQHD